MVRSQSNSVFKRITGITVDQQRDSCSFAPCLAKASCTLHDTYPGPRADSRFLVNRATLKRLASALMAKLLFRSNFMSKPPLSDPSPAETESLSAFVARQEDTLNRARKAERGAQLIESANDAAEAIRARVPGPSQDLSDEERAALIAVKRMLFNAAADIWPGWSVDDHRTSREELDDALDLARQSADLVEVLNLGKCQQGTAAWLVGAFELALGQIQDSLTSFSRAERLYADADEPALVLLARGYSAIACEAGGSMPGCTPSLSEILEQLSAGNFREGKAFCEQLRTAHTIFTGR